MFPVRTLDDMQSLKLINPRYVVKPTFFSRYKTLTSHLDTLKEFEPMCVDEYTPVDTRNRRYYIDHIDNAISHKCILYRVAAGNSLGTHNFLWKIPMNQTEEDRISKNQEVIQKIQKKHAFIPYQSNATGFYRQNIPDMLLEANACKKSVKVPDR